MSLIPDGVAVTNDGFKITPASGRSVSYADDGSPIIHDEWAMVTYTIIFELFPVTQVQYDEILNFYQSNRYGTFEWQHPLTLTTYLCSFVDIPSETGIYGLHLSIGVSLVGRRL